MSLRIFTRSYSQVFYNLNKKGLRQWTFAEHFPVNVLGYWVISRTLFRTPAKIQDEEFYKTSEWLIDINYCCKALNLRCFRESWIRLWLEFRIVLTIYFYTHWKRQKTFGFLTFSGEIERLTVINEIWKISQNNLDFAKSRDRPFEI